MMPPAGRPRSSSLDRATRQQLDELDVLMQRMLALPVDAPEDLANAPRQEPAGESISESTSASAEAVPAATPEPSSSDQAEQVMVEDAPLPPTAAPASLPPSLERMESWGYPSRTASAPESTPFAGLGTSRTAEAMVARSREISEERTRRPRVAWPLYPLLWINLAFDGTTTWLGPPGRWLRGPSGRALLGWSGLLLFVAALAWLALDTLGWTW